MESQTQITVPEEDLSFKGDYMGDLLVKMNDADPRDVQYLRKERNTLDKKEQKLQKSIKDISSAHKRLYHDGFRVRRMHSEMRDSSHYAKNMASFKLDPNVIIDEGMGHLSAQSQMDVLTVSPANFSIGPNYPPSNELKTPEMRKHVSEQVTMFQSTFASSALKKDQGCGDDHISLVGVFDKGAQIDQRK